MLRSSRLVPIFLATLGIYFTAPVTGGALLRAQEETMRKVDGHAKDITVFRIGLRHGDSDVDARDEPRVEEEVITVPASTVDDVLGKIEAGVGPFLRKMVEAGLIYRGEVRQRPVDADTREIRLLVVYPPRSIDEEAPGKVASRWGRESWLEGMSAGVSRGYVDTKALGGFSDSRLQRHAAEIHGSYIALSLLEARERGATPGEEGRRVGSLFARYKEPQRWGRQAHRLAYHALAKVTSPAHELKFGRATFTLRSRYDGLHEYLDFYDASMEDYVAWLEGLHEAIGAVEGYTMSAEIRGDWLVETYRDTPDPRLVPAADLPEVEVTAGDEMTPREKERYAGVYWLTSTTGDPSIQWVMQVGDREGRLWIEWHRKGERAGHGFHLVPLEGGRYAPGWYPDSGEPTVLPGQSLRFVAEGAGPAGQIDFEAVIEGDPVLYRFSRRAGPGSSH